jgi:acetate kinase
MVILVLNCGSSSLKWSLFRAEGAALTRLAGASRSVATRDYHDAILEVRRQLPVQPGAIAHRMVHGGKIDRDLVLVDDAVIEQLELATELAPLHNGPALEGIRLGVEFGRPQLVAFDSAFHRTMPEVATRYPLPASIPVRRMGFHGWSHRHACEQYAALSGSAEPTIITLHLGSGCSATAVRRGTSVDTSMGFSPLEGLVMGTRAGDLDPGIITYLLHQGMRVPDIDRLLNRESGLMALAGSSDMRALLARQDPAAQLAIDIFCYRVRKYVGAVARDPAPGLRPIRMGRPHAGFRAE